MIAGAKSPKADRRKEVAVAAGHLLPTSGQSPRLQSERFGRASGGLRLRETGKVPQRETAKELRLSETTVNEILKGRSQQMPGPGITSRPNEDPVRLLLTLRNVLEGPEEGNSR
jgi:hypothetical protein